MNSKSTACTFQADVATSAKVWWLLKHLTIFLNKISSSNDGHVISRLIYLHPLGSREFADKRSIAWFCPNTITDEVIYDRFFWYYSGMLQTVFNIKSVSSLILSRKHLKQNKFVEINENIIRSSLSSIARSELSKLV